MIICYSGVKAKRIIISGLAYKDKRRLHELPERELLVFILILMMVLLMVLQRGIWYVKPVCVRMVGFACHPCVCIAGMDGSTEFW